MKITIRAEEFYQHGDCVLCSKSDVCRILQSVKDFPLDTELSFDCPYADLDVTDDECAIECS